MEQRPPSVPKLAWVKEEEEGPGAAPAQHPKEVQQLPLKQEDAGMDGTQEQDAARGLFRRTAQEETSDMGTGSMANSGKLLNLLVKKGVSTPEQVPTMVRYIHQRLMSNEFGEHNLDRTLLELTKAHPADVVITLLRVAPSCDRAATTMWRMMMSSSRTAEPVLLTLVDVLENWPEHSTCTSDGDNTHVFALAATVVMWKILQVPCCPYAVRVYSPRLFVHLLFQVFFSTSHMPEEVNTFWKGCQEQHGLATNPNRFAVQTLKALLCLLQCEHVVVAMETKCGWDTLLCVDTRHYAVGVLASEMHRASTRLSSGIARHLLELLSREESAWALPALVFLVEILEGLDLSECSDSVLEIMAKNLQSECRERRRQVLRALLVLIDNPSMAGRMQSLTEHLMKLLRDADGDMVALTLRVLGFTVLDKKILISSPIALQLAGALLPLFDNDNSLVQLLSMFVFENLMIFLEEEGKKPFMLPVRQSLLPLFFHCHDENQDVAEISWSTLLRAAKFLKKKDLKKLVKKKELWKFGECLLAEDLSRRVKYLHQAVPYLDSPQEPLREAAIRFIGMAGRHLRAESVEFQFVCLALEHMTTDISPALSNLALQNLYIMRALERASIPIFQKLQDQLHRAWKTRPRLWGHAWLSCWSSVES